MSLIKPSFVESQFYTFFRLEADRPHYYNLVFRLGRSIFIQLGFDDKAKELYDMIKNKVEKPFESSIFAILEAYYNPRFMYSKLAYCKVGEGVDTKEITRYEMTKIFEEIKDWVYDEITALTRYVRFTRTNEIMN